MSLRTLLHLFALVLSVHVPVAAAELTVFAAASLTDAVEKLAPEFRSATGHTLRFNLGSSGMLARQIKEGAPCDVFISADELRIDQLQEAGLLLEQTRRTVLMNQLVVVMSTETSVTVDRLEDLALPQIRRIAIGETTTVPAGAYARKHLERIGLWPALASRMIPVDNARTVLTVVESGNADAGFVYRTDAMISNRVRIGFEVPLDEGLRITYPAAVIRETEHADAARTFVVWLCGADAQAIFARLGFLAPPAE